MTVIGNRGAFWELITLSPSLWLTMKLRERQEPNGADSPLVRLSLRPPQTHSHTEPESNLNMQCLFFPSSMILFGKSISSSFWSVPDPNPSSFHASLLHRNSAPYSLLSGCNKTESRFWHIRRNKLKQTWNKSHNTKKKSILLDIVGSKTKGMWECERSDKRRESQLQLQYN